MIGNRHCPNCNDIYAATITTETEAGEISAVCVSPCPDAARQERSS